MYRRFTPLFVVLLVALAGCVGGVGEDGSDPAAGDGDGAAGEGDSGGDSPADGGDGAGSDGGDGDAPLAENRTAVLREAGSYTSTWSTRVTEDGAVVSETAYTTAIDYAAARSHFTTAQTSDGTVASGYEVFHADGTTYSRFGEDETASYTVSEGAFTGTTPFDAGSYLTGGDDLSGFERTGTETFDGVSVTRYVLTERPSWVAAQQLADAEVVWDEFTFEVLVDGDGLVRSEGWSASGTDDEGVTHSVAFSFAVTGVGSTTVEDPEWVTAARENAAG